MTKRVIKIELDESGNVTLTNNMNTSVLVSLERKQLETQKIFELISYENGLEFSLEGDEIYTDDQISGPKNEKYRLYNYVHEYMTGLIAKLSDIEDQKKNK